MSHLEITVGISQAAKELGYALKAGTHPESVETVDVADSLFVGLIPGEKLSHDNSNAPS